MKISKHLSLAEVTRSETAKRNGIDNTPTAEHLENFKLLSEKVFEPVRLHFGVPIYISSGYRSEALNKLIKGSSSSQHCKGEAIDMQGVNVSNAELFEEACKLEDFDQIIWEFGTDKNPDWVHVSYTKGKNRKQKLKAVRLNGKTSYLNV